VPEAKTEGLSHQIGSGQLIEGLDEAIIGLKEGESKDFPTTLAAGEHAGKEAQVSVTVKTVKERELPEPDDEFAQLASEFDTIGELKESLTEQVRRVKRIGQAEQIRDKALEALLEQTEVALPESVVQATVDETVHNAIHGLDHDEEKFAAALVEQGSSREEFDADNRANAEKAVKTQLLMDEIADKLEIQVGQDDISERIVLMARQYGIEPQQLIQILQQNNQLPAMFADVRRGKTIAAVVHTATITDSDGNTVDTAEFFGSAGVEDEPVAEETALEAEAAPEAEDDAEEPKKAKKESKAKSDKDAKDEKPKAEKAKKAKKDADA
jgi:trigger factor